MFFGKILFPVLAFVSFGLTSTAQSEDYSLKADTCPIDYISDWTGFGKQNNAGEWQIDMTIYGGEIGQVIGTIDYPSLKCGGTLMLKEVDINYIIIEEKLQYGLWKCVDRGKIKLTLAGEVIDFFWDHHFLTEYKAQGLLGKKLD